MTTLHEIIAKWDSGEGRPFLTDPGKVLGNQWSKLLDFYWCIDQNTDAAWDAARVAAWDAARDAARAAAWDAAGAAAWDAARDAARAAARAAAWDAARVAAWDAAGAAAGAAANEIQASEIFKANGRPYYFLPLFGFQTPDDIPARPSDYGVVA